MHNGAAHGIDGNMESLGSPDSPGSPDSVDSVDSLICAYFVEAAK